MGKSKVWITGLVFMLWAQGSWAQDKHRYVVYFTDKLNSEYTIEQPEIFLSAKAIQRRQAQNIAITTEDLPVNSEYVAAVQTLGADTYYASRWMNAVLVQATPAIISNLAIQNYVLKTEFVAPGPKLNTIPEAKNTIRASNVPENKNNLDTNQQLVMMYTHTMHQEGYTGQGIWIAIFDDGFEGVNLSAAFAPLFDEGRLKDEYDFISRGQNVFQYDDHGTGTLSCAGVQFGEKLLGSGYGADYSLYVTEDVNTEYRIEEYNWLFAAERADSAGVDIISSSLGYSDFDTLIMDYQIEDLDGKTSIITQAATMASARGMLVVSSAGNSGNDFDWPYISMPSDADQIITVGSISANYEKSGFSSVGPTADQRIKPELVALGQGVTMINDRNQVYSNNGTSFSTPLVAGLAAGLWQKYPDLTNLELRELLLKSANRYDAPNNSMGYGLPDYNVAVGNEPLDVSELIQDHVSVYPNPVEGDHINLLVAEKTTLQLPMKFTLISPGGRQVNDKTLRKIRNGMVITLDFKDTSKGVYVLRIESDKYAKNIKILRY